MGERRHYRGFVDTPEAMRRDEAAQKIEGNKTYTNDPAWRLPDWVLPFATGALVGACIAFAIALLVS